MSLAAGLGLMIYAGLANGDVWKEFFQYFRESKFVSVSFHLLVCYAYVALFLMCLSDVRQRIWYLKFLVYL